MEWLWFWYLLASLLGARRAGATRGGLATWVALLLAAAVKVAIVFVMLGTFLLAAVL